MADGVGTTVTGVGTGITTADGDGIHTTMVAGAGIRITMAAGAGTVAGDLVGITGIIGTSGDLERGFGPFLGLSARSVSDQARSKSLASERDPLGALAVANLQRLADQKIPEPDTCDAIRKAATTAGTLMSLST
jgi:hypothetical protein